MKTKVMVCWLSFCAVWGALAQDPSISSMTVRQRWPWSRLVDIDYVLTAPVGKRYDVQIQLYNGDTPLTVTEAAFEGDVFGVTEGARRIVLDPSKIVNANGSLLTQFRVQLDLTEPDLYLIADLATGQISKVFGADLESGAYGAIVTNLVHGYPTLAWTGVTNDPVYKTTKMVFRRVPKGTFPMGIGGGQFTNQVAISKDFYMAVFETTQGQWKSITGSYDPYFMYKKADIRDYRPMDYSAYDYVRGSVAQGINWPSSGTNVLAGGFIGKARAKIGDQLVLDMPTEAQWEYACRAGTETVFNDGDPAANVIAPNHLTNQWLNALGRYKWDGGAIWNGTTWTQPDFATAEADEGNAPVGLYAPNPWGLYDMHGNAAEFCLDWYTALPAGKDDPIGPDTGTARCVRGGHWWVAANGCTAFNRSSAVPDQRYWYAVRFTAPVSR